MHHHQAHALLQKSHVVGKCRVQFVLVHGMAAVLDDNSLDAHIFSLRHRHENLRRPAPPAVAPLAGEAQDARRAHVLPAIARRAHWGYPALPCGRRKHRPRAACPLP